MRKLRGLVLAAVLMVPVSMAQAAEVLHFKANGAFVSAITFDPDTGATTAIFVSREEGNPAVYRIFYGVNLADGTSLIGSGLLPKHAFHVSAMSASLDVDMNDVVLDFQVGDIPEDSVITMNWDATSAERTSGNTKLDMGATQVMITGTSVMRLAEASGSVFGAPFETTLADIRQLHQNTIIITHQ